jgi:O-antigen ligase
MLIYLIFAAVIILYVTLCWFYSDKVFFLVSIFIPLYFLQIDFFDVGVSPIELFLIIFLITFFFRFKDFYNKKIQEIAQSNFSECFWAIFLLLVGGFLSTIFSNNFLSSLHAFFAWFVEPILIFVSGIKILSSTRNRKIFLQFLFLSFVIIIIASCTYLFLGIKNNERLSGFYNSPNFLAMVLEFFIPVITTLLFFRKNNFWQNVLFFLILATSLMLVVFTQSFGGLLAIALAGIWILFWTPSKKRASIFYGAAIFTGLIFVIFFILSFNLGKIDRLLSGDSQSSFNSRLPIWQTSLYLLKDNWVLGIGPNAFLSKFHLKQKELGLNLDFLVVPQPHNIYLAFWLESGILGLIGFFWIVKKAFNGLINKLRLENQNDLRWLLIGLGGSLIAVLAHGFFDTPYFKIDLAYYFWMIILLIKML